MKGARTRSTTSPPDSFNAARNSPHLEIFRKKGIEVLLLSDRVDEWVVGHLTEFDGKPLVSVAKGGLDLGELEDEAEKKEQEHEAERVQAISLERIKASLGERVKDVRVTQRLTESPACLVADEHDMSGNLARLLKAAGQKAPAVEADPRDQSEASGRAAPEDRGRRSSTTGPRCCSTRRCSPKAGSSTIRRRSSSGSTR